MSPYITKSYQTVEGEGHIIEINDMVDTKIHVYADNKSEPNKLFENISKQLKKTF